MSSEVLFEPFPKQIEFLSDVFSNKYDVIMYGGAIRGGKSYAGIGALLLLCKKFPYSRWAIVRNTLPTLKRTTIPSFNKICPKSFIKSYSQDTQVVTFQNGSQIMFFAENYDDDKDLNRWKGLEVNGFLFEEVNELQLQSFYKGVERSGSHIISNGKQPKNLILCTCNPANNWVKELFYDRWKNGTLPERWKYISAKITDNPFIPADYLESLKSMPRYEYEIFVNGNWDIEQRSGAEAYKEFNIDKHVGKCEYDPALPLHLSFDENVNPYFPCGVFQIVGKKIMLIDEILGKNPNNTVAWICREITRKYQGHQSGMFIYGDATSQKDDVKQEKGYDLFRLIMDQLAIFRPSRRVSKSNPSVVMRLNFFNTVLYSNFGGIEFLISDKCKASINDFQNTKEDSDGKKSKKAITDPVSKVSYQQFGHITDLSDYLLCYACASEYMDYQKGGTAFTITTGKNYSKNSY